MRSILLEFSTVLNKILAYVTCCSWISWLEINRRGWRSSATEEYEIEDKFLLELRPFTCNKVSTRVFSDKNPPTLKLEDWRIMRRESVELNSIPGGFQSSFIYRGGVRVISILDFNDLLS